MRVGLSGHLELFRSGTILSLLNNSALFLKLASGDLLGSSASTAQVGADLGGHPGPGTETGLTAATRQVLLSNKSWLLGASQRGCLGENKGRCVLQSPPEAEFIPLGSSLLFSAPTPAATQIAPWHREES